MSEKLVDGYSLFDVLGVGLSEVEPLTEKELGGTFDQMIESGVDFIVTREEFIENAFVREAEILDEDLKQKEEVF